MMKSAAILEEATAGVWESFLEFWAGKGRDVLSFYRCFAGLSIQASKVIWGNMTRLASFARFR